MRQFKGEVAITKKVKYDKLDITTEEWLGRCTMGHIWKGFNVNSIILQLG